MTIAIGIRCDEGNLILADRQVTKEGGLKYYEKKIREVADQAPKGFFNVAFAYAGFPDAAKFVAAETERCVSTVRSMSLTTLRQCVQEALEVWWKKHRRQGDLELLVSLFLWGSGSTLLRSKGKLLVDAEFECLGIGDSSVIRYFMETFVTDTKGLHQLLPLCIYVMEQAKKYIDGCGGKTDVFYTFKDRMVGRLTGHGAAAIQSDNAKIERYIRHLFAVFHNPAKTEEQFSKELEYVKKVALVLRGRLESNIALRHTQSRI